MRSAAIVLVVNRARAVSDKTCTRRLPSTFVPCNIARLLAETAVPLTTMPPRAVVAHVRFGYRLSPIRRAAHGGWSTPRREVLVGGISGTFLRRGSP